MAWRAVPAARLGLRIWSGADRVLLENVRFLAAYRRPGAVSTTDTEQAWQQVADGEELALAERQLDRVLCGAVGVHPTRQMCRRRGAHLDVPR